MAGPQLWARLQPGLENKLTMLCCIVLDSGSCTKEPGLRPYGFNVMVLKALVMEYQVIEVVCVHGILFCTT